MAAFFNGVRFARSATPRDAGNEEGDHGEVHDRADDEENDEQDVELARFGGGVAERALIVLVAAGGGRERKRHD